MKLKSVFLSLILCLGLLQLTGCGSTPAANTYKSEGVLITAVDTGMNAWGDYVRAGHATQVQVDSVKLAYNDYYNAQMIAKAAFEKYLAAQTKNPSDVQSASAAVSLAESSLLSLLNQFLIKQ